MGNGFELLSLLIYLFFCVSSRRSLQKNKITIAIFCDEPESCEGAGRFVEARCAGPAEVDLVPRGHA